MSNIFSFKIKGLLGDPRRQILYRLFIKIIVPFCNVDSKFNYAHIVVSEC